MPYIDTHAHVFSHQATFVPTARYHPNYTVTVEDYIQQLDRHNFNQGVLIQPSFLGTDNRYMLAAIAAYPKRLKGMAVLDNQTDSATLWALDQQGIVGVRLNLFGLSCPDLTLPEWHHFLTRLAAIHWQIEIHAPTDYLVQLLPMLKPYALEVVIDHFGRFDGDKGVADPDYQTLLTLLDPTQHWVKVSGYYRLGSHTLSKEGVVGKTAKQNATEAFALLVQCGMQNRLVWGSDWPHTQNEREMSFDKALSDFKDIVNDETLYNQILTKNNSALFRF